jgi:hypothetical protein
MENNMNVRKLLIFVIVGILLTACAVKNSDAIKGKWQSDVSWLGSVEFGDNGLYQITTPDGNTITGTYVFTNDNTVEVSVPADVGGTYSVGVKVSGDRLTFTSLSDGSSSSLTRVK